VRFSLQEVKKTVQRGGLSLHFLRPGELHAEIERMIACYEGLLGAPQKRFSPDEVRALVGDYRLANCLNATLSAWYSWQGRAWAEVVRQAAGDEAIARLEAVGVTSPVTLRLALYHYVNEHYHGFLPADRRTPALQAFAASYGLSAADLEYLLALDSEDEALLVRASAEPPTAREVATLYNQWAFEAALCNASNVHFVIDCGLFQAAESGLGAIIKRLCFLARKLGVYYDLAYEPTLPGVAPLLHLTLYGPQDVTGLPQQYGLRLARLCRFLLGYSTAGAQTMQGSGRRPGRKGANLVSALLEASAVVHLSQRAYRFSLDASLLNLLPAQPNEENVDLDVTPRQSQPEREGAGVFDSGIEQLFAEAFAALERSRGVDGWRLEREPEPLLLEAGANAAGSGIQSIFIPDFALTRATRRIYMEILGFWTPAYRERKVQKLHQLQGRGDIVLAIPVEAREAFAAIATSFPIVWYEGQLSATDVLSVLHAHYDDFAERSALIDVEAVRARVLAEGLLPEPACYEALHCYRRSEIQRASERIVSGMSDDIAFVPGVGLFATRWMEHLKHSFVEWIGERGALSLVDVLRESRERWPLPGACEDATIEAIISLWPEVRINRTSIFAATVALATTESASEPLQDVVETAPVKRQVRERRPGYGRKRSTEETVQGDLWG